MSHVLHADLNFVSLGSLLQVAESERLSGAFQLEPEGNIVVWRGEVVEGICGRLSGLDAVLTLLMVHSEHARFEQFDVPPGESLGSMLALVIDGARLNDDWGNLAARVLKPVDDIDISALPVPTQQTLAALDGHRIVDEAIRLAGVDVVVVIDDLLELFESRQLREVAEPRPERMVRKPATATPAPQRRSLELVTDEPEDFYGLVDASRSALRSKDFPRARALLEKAQLLRPDDRLVGQNLRRLAQLMGD